MQSCAGIGCRRLKRLALVGVVFTLGAGQAAAQVLAPTVDSRDFVSSADRTVAEGSTIRVTVGVDIRVAAGTAAGGTLRLQNQTAGATWGGASAGEAGDWNLPTEVTISTPANTGADALDTAVYSDPFVMHINEDTDAEDEGVQIGFRVVNASIPAGVTQRGGATALSGSQNALEIRIIDDDEQGFEWLALPADRKENAAFDIRIEAVPPPYSDTPEVALQVDVGYRLSDASPSFSRNAYVTTVSVTPPDPDGNRVEDTVTVRAYTPGTVQEVLDPLEITVEDVHALPAADAITAQAFTDDEGRPSRTGTGEVREGDLVHVTVTVDRGAAGYPLGEDLRVALELAAASEAGAGDYRLEDVSALDTFGTGAGETSKTFKLRTVADDDVGDETLVFDLVATGKNPVNGPGESVGTFSIEIVDATEKQVRPRDDAAAAIDAARGDGPLNPGGSFTLDVGDLFEFDRFAFDVTYSAEVDDQAVADAEVTGTELTVTALEPGDAHVTVKATAEPRTSSAVSTRQQAANVAEVRFDVRVVLRELEVTLSSLEARLTEGEEATITAEANRENATDINIRLLPVPGSTALPDDYSIENEGTITIAAGDLTGTTTLTAEEDGNYKEGTENLTLQGWMGDMEVGSALTFTIVDAERAPLTITLSLAEASVTEGESVTVTATASRAVDEDTTVRLRGVGGSASHNDYSVEDITIDAGATTGTATLTAVADDDDREGSETLTLQGSVGDLVTNTLDLTIADPEVDVDPLTVTLSVPEDRMNLPEGGSVTVTATASRAVDEDTTVRLRGVGGSASHNDYSVGDITIDAGATTGTATLTAVADDDNREGSEALTLRGSVGDLATNALEFTILDPLAVTLSTSGDGNVTEGESATVMATANRPVEADTTVRLKPTGASTAAPVDYTIEEIVRIAAGKTTGTVTLTAVADDDDTEGSETLVLQGSVGDMELETNTLTFTIQDPDVAPLAVTLSAAGDGNVTEGESATVMATASRAVTADTTVRLLVAGGSAAPDDYAIEDITIAAGETTGAAEVMAVVDDDDTERSETLELQGLFDGMETNTVTLTLWDAAVPALPVVASLLLAALLAVGGCRRYLRR